MVGNTRRRVQSNRGPDDIDILLSDPMATKEIASRICTIDFKALVDAANEVRVEETTRFPASGRVRTQRPVPFSGHFASRGKESSLKALVC